MATEVGHSASYAISQNSAFEQTRKEMADAGFIVFMSKEERAQALEQNRKNIQWLKDEGII